MKQFNRHWILVSLILAWKGITCSNPCHGQESVQWHKQRTFEHTQALGQDWLALRESLISFEAQTGHSPILVTVHQSLTETALLINREAFRQGDAISFSLIHLEADSSFVNCVPELWVDGLWIGSGWDAPLIWTVPETADLTSIEVRWGESCSKPSANVVVQLKNLCIPPEPSMPPWASGNSGNPWWIGTFHNGEPVTGMALTRLSSDGVFDRPLVIVEGFDPALTNSPPSYGYGTMNWDVLWNCTELAYPNTTSMPTLLDSLIAGGMDLVYLDFMDGTKSVEAQAQLLGELFEKVAQNRVGNHPSVVVGASMGGLIARFALRQRELSGKKDCVHQFITLDTPHEGAYLPIALQEALGFFSQYVANAAELLDVLQSPAAQELLFITPDGVPVAHGTLMAQMEELGWPTSPNCLAISNAHPDIAASVNAEALLEGWVSNWGVNWAHIGLWALPGNPVHPASNANANVLFECSMPNSFGAWWSDPILSGTAWCNPSAISWEHESASVSPHLQALQAGLSEVGFEFTSVQEWSAFVPLESAWNASAACTACRIEHRHEPLGSSPASHCNLTGHVDFLLDYILNGQYHPQPGAGDGPAVHHWGALRPTHHWLHGDTLHAGQSWSIGTPLGNGGWGMNWPRFDVRMVPCSAPLVLDSEGNLDVGEWSGNGTGRLVIPDGGAIHLNPGGILKIGSSSELVLEPGSTLLLSGGELLISENARILALPGSLVQIAAESTWQLPTNSEIHLHGEVLIQAGQTWSLIGGDAANLDLGGAIYCNDGSEWNVDGQTGNLPVSLHGMVEFQGDGWIKWNHVDAQCAGDLVWLMEARQHWKDVRVFADSSTTITSENRWRWEHGAGSGLRAWHWNSQVADPFWRGVEFQNCELSLLQDDPHLSQCIFEATALSCSGGIGGHLLDNLWHHYSAGIGLELDGMQSQVYLTDNEFINCQVGIQVIASNLRLKCNHFGENDIGIRLSGNSLIQADGDVSGGNSFDGNNEHVHWDDAPWWQINGGDNDFGWAGNQAFGGQLCCLSTNLPATYILPAEGNHWANSLELGNFELSVQGGVLLDIEPQSNDGNPCDTPIVPQVSDEPKHLQSLDSLPCENSPHSPGIFEVYDMQGKLLSSVHSSGNEKMNFQRLLEKLEGGLHMIRWIPDDPSICAWGQWIWHQ